MKFPSFSIRHTGLVLGILLSGCAADQQASQIAIHTAQNVAAYDQLVSRKVAAEKAFYNQQIGTLREILGGVSDISEPNTQSDQQVAASLQRTLPYGRIVTKAHREARVMADRVIAGSTPASMEQLITYIDAGVVAEQADLLDFIKRQRMLANDFQSTLVPIKQQQSELKALRNSLTQLATKPSAADQIKLAIEFGEAVKKELDKKK